MIIKFDTNIFHAIENESELSYFISNLTNNHRYEIIVELTEVKESILYKKLSNIDRELIELSFNEFVTESNFEDYLISQTSESDNSFNFEEARIFFNQQYLIVLENSLNDGYFIDALIKSFKSVSQKIQYYKNNDWLKYANGGGCTNIENYIERTKKRFDRLPKDNKKYLRCFVIIDSDKKYPQQPNTMERINLFNYLDDNGIKYHQLYKREIENYLPVEIIRMFFDNDDYISILEKFSDEMLDFYDIERGFINKDRLKLPNEVQTLYASISDVDFRYLRSKKFKTNGFKKEVPKLFNRVTKGKFKEKVHHQDNPDELEDLLKAITKEL